MKIAVEGCCHGELDKIYETIAFLEKKEGVKVDLLLCCGDFQAVRNPTDMGCMAVPPKYQKMNTFYKYYSGEKKAPILTIFIGGNHEASNYLQELAYGGWVAPNIYYLGYAGVVQIGGIRIGGLSGIYKGHDYLRGRFEHVPYDEKSKRSVYHIRNVDVFRLKQISRPVDIMLSHDWPAGVYNHGNYQQLARFKPFFAEEMAQGTLGSPPASELLHELKPRYWFSAHLHAKFAALVQHESPNCKKLETRFLALDKCLPKRRFLQLLDVPHDTSKVLKLELDPEWLCILKSTNHLMKMSQGSVYMPGPGSKEKYDFTVSDDDISDLKEDFAGELSIPKNFKCTASTYHASQGPARSNQAPAPRIYINQQTTLLCEMLGITDPNTHFTNEKPVLSLPKYSNGEVESTDKDSGSSSSSSDVETNGDTTPSYDSFIVSREASSLELSQLESSFKLSESLDEKFVTAVESLSDISQDFSRLNGVAEMSETSENLSQDDCDSSPPEGMLSPPPTSGEEQLSYSDKDSNCNLSLAPTKDGVSPKRSLDADPESAQTLNSPKGGSQTGATETKQKKFKRRNHSLYESTD